MFSDPQKNVSQFGFMPGQKVADLGSGAGHYALALSTILGPDGLVICVDVQKDLLVTLKNQATKEGKTNIEVILGDVEKPGGTKIKDETLDGAVFSNLLFQLVDKTGAIAEAKRILKPGGIVGVVEWSDLSFMSGIKHEGQKLIVSKDEIIQVFEASGFTLQKTFEAGDHHYGLIFKK